MLLLMARKKVGSEKMLFQKYFDKYVWLKIQKTKSQYFRHVL